MNDIYERLRERLEMMATGYPATENGVEIKILRQLFREEDADLFLKMEARPETVQQVALRNFGDTTLNYLVPSETTWGFDKSVF